MLKLIFRILLLGLGLFTIYSFGFPGAKTLWYRTSGKVVEGRVSEFLAGRNSPSVQQESTGQEKAKRGRGALFFDITRGAQPPIH